MRQKILVSAGEASGDLYASRLVEQLRGRLPEADFFGCAGHRMREAGVRAVVDAASLSVVGLLEVVSHIPRVFAEYRRLVKAAQRERPAVAVLTDSPDFHLRVARRLRALGIPVVYFVAPQAWAWRRGRVHTIRRNVKRLLCIFPFEEPFFRRYGIAADYIGHPLARIVKPMYSRAEFLGKHSLEADVPLITLLPGSRTGEVGRHMPALLDAVERIREQTKVNFVLASPPGAKPENAYPVHWKQIAASPIRVVEGETWDAIAHADLALAASGTVTVEAALLGTPMVTFYRVSGWSWRFGRWLVEVPFYSMVNLVAERAVVPELIQNEMTGRRIAAEALRLLKDRAARDQMKQALGEVAARLWSEGDPMEKAAGIVQQFVKHGVSDVS